MHGRRRGGAGGRGGVAPLRAYRASGGRTAQLAATSAMYTLVQRTVLIWHYTTLNDTLTGLAWMQSGPHPNWAGQTVLVSPVSPGCHRRHWGAGAIRGFLARAIVFAAVITSITNAPPSQGLHRRKPRIRASHQGEHPAVKAQRSRSSLIMMQKCHWGCPRSFVPARPRHAAAATVAP